jgi:4-amino-4-deoxy-L-arabinose transferase-like glycosyltransferase
MIRYWFEKFDHWARHWAEDRYFLWKLFAFALLLRVALVLLNPAINLISDMLGYHESAVSLLESGDFRVKGRLSATRPPMYSVFMFVIYYVFGTGNLLAVRLIQCVLGAVTAVLTASLGTKVFSRRAGVWAGLFFAIYPASIGYADLLLSETFFTFFFIAGLIFLVEIPDGKIKDVFFAAVFLGIATLTRTVLFQLPLFLAILYLVFHKKRLSNLPKLAVLLATFWVILIPWLARNERVFDKPILTTKSGVDFYLYNHNPFNFIILNYSYENPEVFGGIIPWQLSEMERDQICREAAIKWVKEHPFLFLFKGIRMQWNFFGVEREYIWSLIAGYWPHTPRWALALSFFIFAPWIYVLMPLFIWGIVYSWNNYPRIKNLLWIFFYFLAVTFVYYGFSRHRTPLNPVIICFAGYAKTAYTKIFDDLKLKGIFKRRRAAIAFGILVFFIIGWILEILIDVGSLFNLGFTHEIWQNIHTD